MNIYYEHVALGIVAILLVITFAVLLLTSDRVNLLMSLWKQFLDSLDTAGGHIVLLMLAVAFGLIAYHLGFTKADDILVGAGTALMIKLKADGVRNIPQ